MFEVISIVKNNIFRPVRALVIILSLYFASISFAQSDVYYGTRYANSTSDTLPQYPGGEFALYDYIAQTFRYNRSIEYQVDYRNSIQNVVLSFVVDTSGTTRNLQIFQCPSSLIEKEFRRVIATMDNWKPASLNNEPIPYRIFIPFSFTFEGTQMMQVAVGPDMVNVGRSKKTKWIKAAVLAGIPGIIALSYHFQKKNKEK